MTQASTEVEPWASLAERVASLLRVAPAERASSFLTVVQRAANELEVSLAPASRGDETALAAGSLVEVDSSLDSLPNELLHRIVVMACAGFGNRAAWQMVGAIASVCHTLHTAAAAHWGTLLRGFLPSQALPERVWASLGLQTARGSSGCLAQLHRTASTPRWLDGANDLLLDDGAAAMLSCELPRFTFAHTSCLYAGKLYLFGGRHALAHTRTHLTTRVHAYRPYLSLARSSMRRPLLRVRALLSLRLSPWPHARPRPGTGIATLASCTCSTCPTSSHARLCRPRGTRCLPRSTRRP